MDLNGSERDDNDDRARKRALLARAPSLLAPFTSASISSIIYIWKHTSYDTKLLNAIGVYGKMTKLLLD